MPPMLYFYALNSLRLSSVPCVCTLALLVKEWLLCRCGSVGVARLPLTAAKLSNGCRGGAAMRQECVT